MNKRKNWIPTAWTICLIIASLQPLRPVVARNGSLAHLLLHVLVFGVTAFFLLIRNPHPALRGIILGTFWLAIGIELAQHVIYKHPFEWLDIFADAVGVALAILRQAYSRRASFVHRL